MVVVFVILALWKIFFIRFVNDHIALKTANTSTNMVFAKSSMRERISFYQKRQSQSKNFFFLQQGLFDWLSGITHLSRYWSEVPKGMWHHYEAWPYHLLPCSLYAGLGQNLMPSPPKVGTWCVIGKLVVVLFVFLTSWHTSLSRPLISHGLRLASL